LKFDSQSIIATASAVVSKSLVFKANALYNVGPREDYAGSFASNYPSGLTYLLSNYTSQPGGSPYGQYRVAHSHITVEIINNAAVGINVCIFPMVQSSAGGLSASNIREQPRAVFRYVPASTSVPITTLNSHITTYELNGLTKQNWESNPNFTGLGASTDPGSVNYWNVVLNSNDATTAMGVTVNTRILYRCEFFGNNNMSTAAPAITIDAKASSKGSSSSSSGGPVTAQSPPVDEDGYVKLSSADFTKLSSVAAFLKS
jgi:hypothetical protein